VSDFDLAVIGSGFAGSLFALLARRIGRTVVLLEKGTHPRFAIGESSSPLANLLLEDLCRRFDLPRVAPLAAFGTWRRRYPEIACGLKRGFTFYGHGAGQAFRGDPERRDQLLVAASPRDEIADTHWYRADFDHFLVREAQAAGAEYLDRVDLESIVPAASGSRLEGRRLGQSLSVTAHLVVDASGPSGFLHRALGLPQAAFPGLPKNEGLYAHFEAVRRMDEVLSPAASADAPPYPPDDAALHHVFDGGWIWVLRFGNGITSAGIAAEPRLVRELRLAEGAPAWQRALARLPTVARQFEGSRAVRPFVHVPRLPFRSGVAAGDRWALLPSAAAFVDPLLSTGIPLALTGIERLIGLIERDWKRPELARALDAYGTATLRDADAAALLTAALYAAFSDFELFADLSLLYFAAASFAEAARRLGRPGLSGCFLSHDHSTFGPALREVCAEVLAGSHGVEGRKEERARLLDRVSRTVALLDVVGLSDKTRRNWHPVEAQPLMDGAAKLGATRGEIEAMLRESGFFPDPLSRETLPPPAADLRARVGRTFQSGA